LKLFEVPWSVSLFCAIKSLQRLGKSAVFISEKCVGKGGGLVSIKAYMQLDILIHIVHNVHSMKVEVEIAYLVSFCQELT